MWLADLSTRQLTVARYIAQGFTDKQIGALMGRSEATVAYHVSGIVKAWHLNPSRNIRVQITHRVLLEPPHEKAG